MPKTLPSPVADTKSVEDLTDLVMRGAVRIPVYQRDLRWEAEDVLALLDSISRGYPMGSLLFHERQAPAKIFELGPLTIHAPEQSSALDVVDGQQRLVALSASLRRPEPIPTTPDDPYVVYFDVEAEEFRSPPRTGEIPETWVPLPVLADASVLNEWVFEWSRGRDAQLRKRLFEVGKRLRQYKVPMYTVSVAKDDVEVLGEIFHRINNSGKPLQWRVIHDALYGHHGEGKPATLSELSESLAELAMGRPEQEDLLRCLIAFEGRDVTRSLDEHHRSTPGFLKGTAASALPALRRVLGFLRRHAKIHHLRLLPRTASLSILTRFFRLHPEPQPRSQELLKRWLWRSFLAARSFDERTFQRRGVSVIDDDEELSVQRLLALVPSEDPYTFEYPERFDARAADSRVVLLAMSSLEPRALDSGRPLDVAELIERSGTQAFRRLTTRGEELSRPANRIFLPGSGSARAELLAYLESEHASDAVLRSHAISAAAVDALRDGGIHDFLIERDAALRQATRELGERLAAWDRGDHASIDYLLESVR